MLLAMLLQLQFHAPIKSIIQSKLEDILLLSTLAHSRRPVGLVTASVRRPRHLAHPDLLLVITALTHINEMLGLNAETQCKAARVSTVA
jgi:hypothetical protein